MAMQARCIAAVNAAAGRTLTKAQLENIESQIDTAARVLAYRDRQAWASMTPEQRTIAAATAAVQDAKHQAQLKMQRQQLQILRTVETNERVQTLQQSYDTTRSDALMRDMDNANSYINGIRDFYWSQMHKVFDAAMSTADVSVGRRALQFLFDVENPVMTRDLAIEIFARGKGGTGNKLAVQAAKAWEQTSSAMNARFNAAGGDIRELDYGYLPQASDQARVRAAGQDAWVQKTLPRLDRSRYLTPEGRLMNDAELTDFLNHAYETLSTGGLNKLTPGQFRGTGARANQGSQHRQLHFKDGQAYLDYTNEFGAGSMYDAMTSHITGLGRSIGLVERYGPNPEHQMRVQLDMAEIEDGRLKRSMLTKPEHRWNVLSGKSGAAQNASVARVASDIRNIQVAGKLGRAVLASTTDIGTMLATSGYNKLGYWETLRNIGSQLDSNTRDFLNSHSIIAESVISDMNRFSGEHIRNNWSGKVANSVMKLSFMNAWTDTLRRAFQMTMMGGMGRMAGTPWSALTEFDRIRMERHGITADDWSVINRAQLTDYRGKQYLTPESIMATGDANAIQVVSKVLGLIRDESEYAVINPDLATRAAQTGGGQAAGTVGGELSRSMMQFKSFPFAMVSRHYRRMIDMPQGADGAPAIANRLGYSMAILLSTSVLGGIAFQNKEILSGRDPVPVNSLRFWTEALAQGGGLSIVGDLLFNDPRESPGGFSSSLSSLAVGPTVGTVADLAAIGIENAWRAASGDELNFGASTARTLRSITPYGNLWWSSAAIDHAFFHALQENLSPGYLSRVERRARREHDQDYWWQLGPGLPDRGPDMSQLWRE